MRRCWNCFKTLQEGLEVCPYCGDPMSEGTDEPRYLKPGTVLMQRYTIGKVVGAGGFGITYAAWDEVLQQKVAIKEYMPGEFSTRAPGQTEVSVYGGEKEEQYETGMAKFFNESRRLAAFENTPGIVKIYNSFEENRTAYIVMEFLEGETLSERLKREGKLSEADALNIMLPILQALDEVHHQGILHRDIAPNNIFLTSDGEVKLLDFGAARSVTGTHSKSLSVLYKAGYTPEEQYRSRSDQGPWTDVYACAATLYKMLTGATPPEALERRRKDELKEPSKAGAKVSRATDIAVMNALNVDPINRTQSARAFLLELADANVKSRFVRAQEHKEGRIPLPVKIACAAAGVCTAAFLVLLSLGIIGFDIPGFSTFMLPEGKTRVPNITNKTVEKAEKLLKSRNITLDVVQLNGDREYKPTDIVLYQTEASGSIVDKDITIHAGVRTVDGAGGGGLGTELSNISQEDVQIVPVLDTDKKIKGFAIIADKIQTVIQNSYNVSQLCTVDGTELKELELKKRIYRMGDTQNYWQYLTMLPREEQEELEGWQWVTFTQGGESIHYSFELSYDANAKLNTLYPDKNFSNSEKGAWVLKNWSSTRVEVPDLTGMTLKEAEKYLISYGLSMEVENVSIMSDEKIRMQSPAKGNVVKMGSVVKILNGSQDEFYGQILDNIQADQVKITSWNDWKGELVGYRIEITGLAPILNDAENSPKLFVRSSNAFFLRNASGGKYAKNINKNENTLGELPVDGDSAMEGEQSVDFLYMDQIYRYTYELEYKDHKWNLKNWKKEENKSFGISRTEETEKTDVVSPTLTSQPTQTPGPTHKSENTRETTISTKKPEETKIATGLEETSEPKLSERPEPSDPSNSEPAVRPSEPPEPSASPKPETPDVTGHPSTVWVICSCGTMHEMTINGDPNVIKNCPGCGKAYSDSYVFDD